MQESSILLLTADSGPLHLAAGLGSSVIAIFGPTSVERTGPVGRGFCKVVKMEGAEDGFAFATGMAAVFSTFAALGIILSISRSLEK